MNVALIIIYNHQYNKNIDILDKLYKDRFSHIFHVVPFYNGTKPNVIPVYENSLYFQGYVAQALNSFIDEKFEHYFFIGDDLILNPKINQHNYKEHLRLGLKTSFVPHLLPLHKINYFWSNIILAYKYKIGVRGVEAEKQLPTYYEAEIKFKKFNLDIKNIKFDQLYQKPILRFKRSSIRQTLRFNFLKYKSKLFKEIYCLPYPLVGSYSDIFVVSTTSIKDFCHYCGVFAATNLHVEIAVPTAMVLASDEIVTEQDLILQGRALWTTDDLKILEKYNFNLDHLLSDFPVNHLYIHPVKLSKWKRN